MIQAQEIVRCQWMRVARGFAVRFTLKDGKIAMFDGFDREDQEKVEKIVMDFYALPLLQREVSVKGYNWGSADFKDRTLTFSVQQKCAFDIPLTHVANTMTGTKNEVAVEFPPPPPADPSKPRDKQREDALVEIRFYVPGMVTQGEVGDADEGKTHFADVALDVEGAVIPQNKVDEDEFVVDEDGEAVSAAAVFCETIKQKSAIESSNVDKMASFNELLCVTPRGRYIVDLYPLFMRLRGKTHDYRILYTSIKRLFLLPKPDDTHFVFCVGLEPPLRQGQTNYPFLVFQTTREEEIELEVNMDEETRLERFSGRLDSQYDGLKHEVLSDVFSAVTSRNVISFSNSFHSHANQCSIPCSWKANEATLYPLDKMFLSIPKPPILFSHKEIQAVTFSRVSSASAASTKTFEVKFALVHGGEHVFSSIPREEYPSLAAFCQEKGLQVYNQMSDEAQYRGKSFLDDYAPEEGDKELYSDEDRQITSRLSKTIGANATMQNLLAGNFDDDSESEDADFGSGDESSGSEVDEEFDENYQSSGDEDAAAATEEPAKKHKQATEEPAKKRKPTTEGGDKGKKKRAKKEKDAPKRANSAFIYFSAEMRPALLAKGLKITECAKELGVMWKATDEASRAKYEKLAKADKERYEREIAEYKKNKPSSAATSPKAASLVKQTKLPDNTKVKSEEFINSDDDLSEDEE